MRSFCLGFVFEGRGGGGLLLAVAYPPQSWADVDWGHSLARVDLLRWFSRDPGDGQATRAHVQMASWRCRCYFHGGRGGVIRRSPASRQLNVLCLIGGVVGGVSSRVGVLSLPTVLWALRWRHVRPNQKRQICVLLVAWFSSFF